MAKKAKKKLPARAASSPVAVIRRVHRLSARYDAAQTTSDNRNHWANTDALSAASSTSSEVRRHLRERARYEVANNSYAKGIGLTIANDTVGVGPTLQLLQVDASAKKLVETLVWEWMQEIRLAEKLRQMRFARFDTGEVFGVFVNNPGLKGPVKLDLQLIETEQIANPMFTPDDSMLPEWDGISYDDSGNPKFYRKLRTHPGSFSWMTLPTEFDDINAEFVFHYFRPDRPGQLRGIPEITPAITLFADLRRFTQATIAAAETAADFAAVVYTDAAADADNPTPAQSEDFDSPSPKTWDLVEFAKRMGVVLPAGYKLGQIKSEHPGQNNAEFVSTKLKEIARCVCVPAHIASLDPSEANMSSAYVVGQMYAQERKVDRSELDYLLDKALSMWLYEATRIPLLLPDLPENPVHQWFWPSLGHHADPQKVANAVSTKLSCGMASFPQEYAKEGLDYEEQQELAAKSLGVTIDEYRELLRNKIFGTAPIQREPIEPDDDDDHPTNGNGSALGARSLVRR